MSESALVKRVEDVTSAAVADERIAAGLESAKYALSVRVDDGESEEQAVQMLLNIKKLQKYVADKKRPITEVLKEATARARDIFLGVEDPLAKAAAYLDAQVRDYKLRVQAEQRRAQAEAEKRAAEESRARREAEAAGAAPPAKVPPPPVPFVEPVATATRVAQGTVSLTWRLKGEMVNPHECDPGWLRLDEAAAVAWARDRVGAEGLERAKGSQVTLRGVRFWYEPGTSKTTR